MPFMPCTAMAPTGSSTWRRSRNITPNTTITPPTSPISIACPGSTNAHGAVIATRPARAPFIPMVRSGLPATIHTVAVAAIAPAAAARLVLMATRAMSEPSPTPRVEPGLKPNQPNQSRNIPSEARGRECPSSTLGLPSGPYLPMRGPSVLVPMNAAQPPTACTTVEPAKSVKPMPASQPPPQIQWPTTGYTKAEIRNE